MKKILLILVLGFLSVSFSEVQNLYRIKKKRDFVYQKIYQMDLDVFGKLVTEL